jgi:hypothetical protein
LGAVGSFGYLEQTVSTLAGQAYLLSLWVDSPDGETPNAFLVTWNGSTLFDETNIGAIGWTNLQIIVRARGRPHWNLVFATTRAFLVWMKLV